MAIVEVPGLFVCPEFISPDVEEELYCNSFLFPTKPDDLTQGRRVGTPLPGFQRPEMPLTLAKVCNGIVESGLYPDFIAPNYCFAISYPEKAQFFYHYDSRYRWGETVAAICLGVPGVMSFLPENKTTKAAGPPFVGRRILDANSGLAVEIRSNQTSWAVDVWLPPRSVYIMSGASRYEWKHMVKHNTATNRGTHDSVATATRFPFQVRRTITLRCTKAYSDEVLQRKLDATPNDKALQARVKAQSKFQPQRDHNQGELTKEGLKAERWKASQEVNYVHSVSDRHRAFFTSDERGYRIAAGARQKSCWPLEGIARGNLSSSLVPTSSQPGAFSSAFQFQFLAPASVGLAGNAGEANRSFLQPASNVNNDRNEDEENLQQALALSLQEASNPYDDRKGEENLQKALALSMQDTAKTTPHTDPVYRNDPKVATGTTCNILTLEALRAKRLAAFGCTTSRAEEEEEEQKKPPALKKIKTEPVVIDLTEE